MNVQGHFKKDDGRLLPVSDDFLLPFLSPTSPGTEYWDPPPTGPFTERQVARAVLQFHQAMSFFRKCGMDFRGKRFLDVGTGAGMLPRMVLHYTECEEAYGIDPYRVGDHDAGTHTPDEAAAAEKVNRFIEEQSPDVLRYDNYKSIIGFEHHSMAPDDLPYALQPEKPYRFRQIGAHDLDQLNQTFDMVYVKAIDHIPDWDGIFRSVAAATTPGGVFLIKHFSFFSYLGPHRYATTNIPWGHLLMTDDEYRRFADEFHPHRAEKMKDFYFTGLSYPRTTLNGLVLLARKHGFSPIAILNEPLRNGSEVLGMADHVDDFWDIVHENWPQLSAEEMFSGRYHIALRRLPDA